MDSADKSYVAYVDMDNGYLKHTTNATGSWVSASVDTAGNIDGQTAITLDDDKNSYILYVNSSGTLKMGTNNSGSWVVESSISADVTGVGTSATTAVKGRSNH